MTHQKRKEGPGGTQAGSDAHRPVIAGASSPTGAMEAMIFMVLSRVAGRNAHGQLAQVVTKTYTRLSDARMA